MSSDQFSKKEPPFTLMRSCRCGAAFVVGLCACGAAIGIDHTYEYKRPSDIVCYSPQAHHELALPIGCDDGSSPENRSSWVTSLATGASSSVTVYSVFLPVPMMVAANDAEHAAEPTGPAFQAVTFGPYGGVPPGAGYSFYLVHPNKDERIALIRQTNKLIEPST